MDVEVDPKHHPKIIGRRGATITRIRQDHDVQIQLPERGSDREEIITITGYESNAQAARDEILQIVKELVRDTQPEYKLASVHCVVCSVSLEGQPQNWRLAWHNGQSVCVHNNRFSQFMLILM